jgi:hypothetical protein
VVQQDKNVEAFRAVDQQLRDNDFDAIALTPDHKYQTWYAVLLSSFALLIGAETVEYAYANYAFGMRSVRFAVFTAHLVLVADIDTEEDVVPVAQVVTRRSLSSMRLSASARIDAKDRQSYEWPGTLNLVLTYPDLPKPIEIVSDGVDRFELRKPSRLVVLIQGLSADLAASS